MTETLVKEEVTLTKEEVLKIEEIIMNDPGVKKWVENLSKAFIAYKTLSGCIVGGTIKKRSEED